MKPPIKTTARYRGPQPKPMWDLLTVAHERGIAVQGDFARTNPVLLALAASCGWVSSLSPDGLSYGNRWRITASGLLALTNKEHFA